MGFVESFRAFFGAGTSGVEQGYGDSKYSDRVDLGTNQYLSYDECKDLYLHWPLGKRVVTAITNFAMSAPREITFKDLPQDCVTMYEKTLNNFKVVDIVRQTANYSRMYGMSAVFIAHKTKKPNEPLEYDDLNPNDISFNILDPLNLAGIQISQNPLSLAYQKVTQVLVNGVSVHPSRICIIFNDIPLYLRWIPSTYSWGSPSVFENMRALVKSWNRCVIALERMATKAGSIIVKHRDGSVMNAITKRAVDETLEQIRNMQNDGIGSFEKDASLELFNLTGVEVVDSIIEQMNKLIMMALADTPSNILLDKDLSSGLSEGSEDAKSMIMAVEYFRNKALSPIYKFLDFYLLRMCFRDEALQELKANNASDIKYDIATLREKVLQGFHVEFANLQPETESEKVQNISTQLDALSKLKELGATARDIQEIINTKINPYETEITLHESTDGMDGEHDTNEHDGESESAESESAESESAENGAIDGGEAKE